MCFGVSAGGLVPAMIDCVCVHKPHSAQSRFTAGCQV